MAKVDRDALRRAMRWDGWLDKETGEIIEADKHSLTGNNYRYVLPEDVDRDRERYVRIPYLDYVQFSLDMIDAGVLPPETMERYGIHRIDYRNESHLLFPPYDGLRGG